MNFYKFIIIFEFVVHNNHNIAHLAGKYKRTFENLYMFYK